MIKVFNNNLFLIPIFIFIILFLTIELNSSLVHGNIKEPTKTYHQIIIEKNDSLWTLANENMNRNYYTIYSYITEVKQINNLPNDTIQAGDVLIIPHID